MITWWMKLRGHNALHLSISGTGSFICLVTSTRLEVGHTMAFDYPVRARESRWPVLRMGRIGPQSNARATSPARYSLPTHFIVGNQEKVRHICSVSFSPWKLILSSSAGRLWHNATQVLALRNVVPLNVTERITNVFWFCWNISAAGVHFYH